MLGLRFGFSAKVRDVLWYQFNFRPSMTHKAIFDNIVRSHKRMDFNEYDAACVFMLVLIDSITVSPDTLDFGKTHLKTIRRLKSVVTAPASMHRKHLEENEIKFGLRDAGAIEVATFEEWTSVYKNTCGKLAPFLSMDADGNSLFDFLDDAPLRRAFADGVDPRLLARQFTEDFDLEKLTARAAGLGSVSDRLRKVWLGAAGGDSSSG